MSQFKKREAGVSNDLFAEKTSVSHGSAADHTLAEDPDEEFFQNPYAEASQARASRRNARSVVHGNTDSAELSTKADPVHVLTLGQLLPDNSAQATIARVDNGEFLPEPAKAGLEHSGARVIPRMMLAADVAAYLRVSVSKVWRLTKQASDFPSPVRIGGSTRWDRQSIDRYLDRLQTHKHPGR